MPPRKRAEPKAKQQCKLMCCTTPPGAVEKILKDIEEWEPGKWAAINNPGPTCSCTLAFARGECTLHGRR